MDINTRFIFGVAVIFILVTKFVFWTEKLPNPYEKKKKKQPAQE